MSELTFTLPPELVEQVAQRVAEILAPRFETPGASPYMTVREAAEFRRCKPKRIHNLIGDGRLTRVKDGGRTLVLRAEVEALDGLPPVAPLPARRAAMRSRAVSR